MAGRGGRIRLPVTGVWRLSDLSSLPSSCLSSWLRTVTVRLGSTKVSLLQRMRVKVDGRRVALPFIKLGVMSVMRDGYRVILRTNEGILTGCFFSMHLLKDLQFV